MELLTVKNGIGYVKLDQREQTNLSVLREIFQESEKKHLEQPYKLTNKNNIPLYIGDSHGQVRMDTINHCINGLFPAIRSSKEKPLPFTAQLHPENISYWTKIIFIPLHNPRDQYNSHQFEELKFALRIPFKGESICEGELKIIYNKEERSNEHMVTIQVKRSSCSYVDDIVKMLGKYHDPNLNGIDINQIAEVPYLSETLQLYNQARKLSQDNKEQLAILQVASLKEENPAIRELSQKKYHRELAELLLK